MKIVLEINLFDIKSIDFYLADYNGRQTRLHGFHFSPGLSQGVGNFLEYTLLNGVKNKVYFRLNYKDQFKEFDYFMFSAIIKGKISFLRGMELLEIQDYEETNRLKSVLT